MFREKYRSMNEQIFPEQELLNKVINSAGGIKKGKNRANKFFLKPVITMSMLIALALTATPVLAANIPAVYRLMYFVSPTAAQFFMPVQKSCESNGVKMEVVSAYIHDDTAEIYITMQDLTGDRVDETTDLYDSYSINRPFDSAANCQFVGYDKSTKTATFLISITQWGNKKIAGDKITFSVREFISGKHTYNEIPVRVDLASIDSKPSTKKVSMSGGGGPRYEKYFPNGGIMTEALVPSAPMDFPVEGINFTGIGYIDDMLHIQTSVENSLTKDNHGSFFLSNGDENRIQCDYNICFSEDSNSDNRVRYDEYVFDIPKSDIVRYKLYGSFVTSGLFTTGNWQVTFPIEEIK